MTCPMYLLFQHNPNSARLKLEFQATDRVHLTAMDNGKSVELILTVAQLRRAADWLLDHSKAEIVL